MVTFFLPALMYGPYRPSSSNGFVFVKDLDQGFGISCFLGSDQFNRPCQGDGVQVVSVRSFQRYKCSVVRTAGQTDQWPRSPPAFMLAQLAWQFEEVQRLLQGDGLQALGLEQRSEFLLLVVGIADLREQAVPTNAHQIVSALGVLAQDALTRGASAFSWVLSTSFLKPW